MLSHLLLLLSTSSVQGFLPEACAKSRDRRESLQLFHARCALRNPPNSHSIRVDNHHINDNMLWILCLGLTMPLNGFTTEGAAPTNNVQATLTDYGRDGSIALAFPESRSKQTKNTKSVVGPERIIIGFKIVEALLVASSIRTKRRLSQTTSIGLLWQCIKISIIEY